MLMLVASGGSLGFYWLSDLPLGVPGEWTWRRHEATPDVAANLILGVMVGAAYLGAAAWGYARLGRETCSRGESVGWQVALAVAAGVWLWTVQGGGNSGATVGRWPLVLYFPSSSGYFFKARYEVPEARQLLRNYEALLREGDVLHVGTHPPGLFLFFHGLIGLAELSPKLTAAINATQPAVVRESFDILRDVSPRQSRSRAPPLNEVDRAVLWLAGLICFSLSVATVWPIYGFLRHFTDRPTSWLCAAAWPLVPSIAVFLPKSDVAYAFLAMTLGWLWLVAWRRSSPWLAGLAGGMWSVGMLCSLAFLPVALWLAVLSVGECWPMRRGEEMRRLGKCVVSAAAVSLGVFGAVWVWGGIPLWTTYWLNYQNHAGFYVQYPRSYWRWLALNPLELAGAVGVPVFLAAAAGLWSGLADRSGGKLRSVCVATLVVWGWLWLSGKNSGEAARLWMFLMPYVVCCCAAAWSSDSSRTRPERVCWSAFAWLACQAAVCLGTVQRIDGFPIDG
jgi:hypothetical protein